MLLNLNLHFSIDFVINLRNVDWALLNEFASVTNACLLIVLPTVDVKLIFFPH